MMSTYTLALFVHIVGVIGVFVGIGIWLFAVAALRRAQSVEQVRTLARLTVTSGNLTVGGVLLLAAAGIFMVVTTWGWQTAWIDVATVSVALLAPFGAGVIDPRIRALAKAANEAPEGPLPASLAVRTRDPLLSVGLHIYVAVLLGIVFLMTIKPALVVAILAMVVAVALGLASGLPVWRTARTQARDNVATSTTHASRSEAES
jgi:hypothetical protein